MKKILALVLVCALALSLAACGGDKKEESKVDLGNLLATGMEKDSVILVQGNLDEIYLGKFNEDYMEMTETTPEECEANYLSGIEVEADFFIYYFEIEYPSDEFRNEVIEFYKEIYSHSNYTVGSASKLDDNTYAVKLNVQPIDIIDQVMTDWDAGMAPFWEKYADVDVSAMSEEEYKQFDADWGRAILDLAKSKMSSIGYMEEQSLAVQVIRDEDGIWQIADNDFSTIDNAIIYYP